MEILAEIIVNKIIEKQKEYDKEFISELEMASMPVEVHEKLSPKDKILMDIASLVIKVEDFVKKEEYDKAEVCQKKISELRKKLDNM